MRARRIGWMVSGLSILTIGTVMAILPLIPPAPARAVPVPDQQEYLARVSTATPVAGDDPAVFPGGPSSPQGKIPLEHLTRAASCGLAGCHPDITRQWEQSVHHLASFNNTFYRKAVDYTRERQGDAGVRWCAGCHDTALLMSGTIDGNVTPETPGANAGVTCIICHSTSKVQDLAGNGRYELEVPNVKMLEPDFPLGGVARQLLHWYPLPHKRGFLQPLHQTAEFCSSCHRVNLAKPQNHYRWLRGQDQFGGWFNGGASGRVARAFYPSAQAKRCQDCHMPQVPSQDAGNDGGFVRSHSFPGANTVVPALAGFEQQAALTKAFLEGSVRVDLFAARELSTAEGQADARWLAPLEQAKLPAGRTVTLDVVVRNLRVGHGFPEGVLDSKDIWLEVVARDARGKELWREGGLDAEGNVLASSHRYGATLLDAAGQRINKRNVGDVRVGLFRRVLGPGQSDLARYRFEVPADCGGALTFEARLRYRKVRADYARWTYAGHRAPGETPLRVGAPADEGKFVIDPSIPVPEIPIVDVSTAQVTVAVEDGQALPAGVQLTAPRPIPLAERWYDYGVGFLLEKDPVRARYAFNLLTQQFPDFFGGPTGYARAALQQGDPDAALTALDWARDRWGVPAAGEAAVGKAGQAGVPAGDAAGKAPHAGASIVQGLRAQALLERGDYADASSQLEALVKQYPQDRSLRVDLGYAYFQSDDIDQAIQTYQSVLEIEPDDQAAHSMLARSYLAAGRTEEARLQQKIFDAMREDVSVQGLRQVYLEQHPEELLETQEAHEHVIGSRLSGGPQTVAGGLDAVQRPSPLRKRPLP